jgi:hypothetical protein
MNDRAVRDRAALITGRKLVPLPPSPLPDKFYAVIDGTGVPMTAREPPAGRPGFVTRVLPPRLPPGQAQHRHRTGTPHALRLGLRGCRRWAGVVLAELLQFRADSGRVGVLHVGEDVQCLLPGVPGSLQVAGGVAGVS